MLKIKDSYTISQKIGHSKNGDRSFRLLYEITPDKGNAVAVYGVLDGVSSANDHRAATMAVGIIGDYLTTVLKDADTLTLATEQEQMLYFYNVMREAILKADQKLLEADHFATTVSIAILYGEHIYTANVGDSPILMVDTDTRTLTPLYTCQNQEAVARQEGDPNAPNKKNVIVKCVGGRTPLTLIDIPTKRIDMPANFILLLGSDGALSVFKEQQIRKWALRHRKSMKSLCERLFRRVQRKSRDDFTILATHIHKEDSR